MRRLAGVFFVFAFLALPVRVCALTPAFSPALSEKEGRPDSRLELSIPYDGSLGELGAFRVDVEYDPDVFTWVRVKEGLPIQMGYSDTLGGEGTISSVYVVDQPGACASLSGQTFTYYFTVREDAPPGDTAFSVSVYDLADLRAQPLGSAVSMELSYTVLPAASSQASLLSLVPSAGELSPEFSSDCFSYRMTVPFEVTSVTFAAQPAEQGRCRVNRKNLGAGGSDTQFLLTVTAEDGETEQVYEVTVHREKKAAVPSPSRSPAPKKTPKPAAELESEPTPAPTPTAQPSPAPASSSPSETSQDDTVTNVKQPRTSPVPTLTILGGRTDLWGIGFWLLFFLVVGLLSRPVARLICRKFPKK